MATGTANLPLLGTMAGFRRFSVPEYHRLIEIGVLTENDRLELLEGYLVLKMARIPPHDGTIDLVNAEVAPVLPPGWMLRIQEAITLADSEPEPDIGIVRGTPRSFMTRHPTPADIGVLLEVADSTLAGDRADKSRIYGRANIPYYWIVNLVDRQIEVYSLPTGPTANPGYGQRIDYALTSQIPLVLDGAVVATLNVKDLLP